MGLKNVTWSAKNQVDRSQELLIVEKSFCTQFSCKEVGFEGISGRFSEIWTGNWSKTRKTEKKLSPFFQGVLIAQKWLIIQSRPLAHNNQNVGLNMGFYSGFFKKSRILAENAINKNARFSRKKGVMTFLSQKQRGMTFFEQKLKNYGKKVITNFMTLKIMSKNFMTLKKMLKNFMTLTIPSGPG